MLQTLADIGASNCSVFCGRSTRSGAGPSSASVNCTESASAILSAESDTEETSPGYANAHGEKRRSIKSPRMGGTGFQPVQNAAHRLEAGATQKLAVFSLNCAHRLEAGATQKLAVFSLGFIRGLRGGGDRACGRSPKVRRSGCRSC